MHEWGCYNDIFHFFHQLHSLQPQSLFWSKLERNSHLKSQHLSRYIALAVWFWVFNTWVVCTSFFFFFFGWENGLFVLCSPVFAEKLSWLSLGFLKRWTRKSLQNFYFILFGRIRVVNGTITPIHRSSQ